MDRKRHLGLPYIPPSSTSSKRKKKSLRLTPTESTIDHALFFGADDFPSHCLCPIEASSAGDNGLLLYFVGQKRNIPVYIK